MNPLKPIMVAALALAGLPAAAQTATSGTEQARPAADSAQAGVASPQSEAESAQTAPETAMANARAEASIGSPVSIDEAQYARDLVAYRAAVRARRQVIAQDAAVQAQHERAYALAMADWRAQVAACQKGKTKACKAPTPDPANYF